jgi:hypothetical protein
MITLSVDPHPGTHTVVAMDPNGSTLASITVPNTPDGLCQLHQFAVPFASRRWAIEGAGNHFIAVFVAQLLERSEIVYSIPPSLTSQYNTDPAEVERKTTWLTRKTLAGLYWPTPN